MIDPINISETKSYTVTAIEEDKQDQTVLIQNEGMFLTLCLQGVPKKGGLH